ncbi:zinc ribbon domain-containing protein [Zhihengliuella halotolerans]|uniref:C4-type zinc ribbon domain-containing protein n=1 Tax=Zhihengliuella halotolerans TaxID=370736 RepID=A0A4Q8ACS2_9MICC|nr:C4-type zinc ribbon domain-containing protein [Zhihengliuella halotolerans]RZU61435.1 hypothetical protein EV380_1005 [Zhihengliuella halotolerans]
MATAAPEEQHRLLELAKLDSAVVSLRRQLREAQQDPESARVEAAEAQARANAEEARAARDAAAADLRASEAAVAKVVAHRGRDQHKLDTGAGTASDMMALSHEVETLTKRQAELEDEELALMERVEAAEAQAATAERALEAAEAARAAVESRIESATADVREQLAAAEADRAGFAATVDTSLVTLYDKAYARRGIGAARLFHGVSEGSGMQLSPGDLAEILAAPAERVVYCPDSGAILVRDPEWTGPAAK